MAIATVTSITGEAYARDENGNLRELRVGDTLEEGEVLVTSNNGRVELDFGDGIAPTVIEGGEQIAMTPDLDANQAVDAEDASASDEDLDALLAELEDGDGDLLENLEATAAGAGGAGAIGGGHGFVRLGRISLDTDPLAFDYQAASLEQAPTVEGENLESEVAAEVEPDDTSTDVDPDPELPPEVISATVLSLESFTVVEGNNVVFTVTTSVAPTGSPLEITLSNGSVMTIPVGETTGSVILNSREDDVYLQGDDTTTITIVSASGGGFDEIVFGDGGDITVVDDDDATAIELFIPQMRPLEQPEQYQQGVQPPPGDILLQPESGIPEGSEVTVGARVQNAPQETDLVITLSNGEQIIIAVGNTEGTVTFELPNVPDGGDTLALTIESVTGGNYEAVDFADALVEFNIRDSVPSTGEASALVDDDGLVGGNQGGTGDDQGQGDNEATFSGSLEFSYGGDGAGTVEFSGMDQQTADLGQEEVIYRWDQASNILTATVNSGARAGTDLFTVTIDNTNTGEYTVELLNNILHSEGDDENNEVANLTYTVTDADGSAASGSLVVNFDDDTPVASDVDAGALTEDGDATQVSGNVFTDGDAAYGADGAGSLTWGVAPAELADYGTLTTSSDGSWSFKLDNSLAAVQALDADDALTFELEYTLTDADGDESTATLTITINGQTDGPPTIVVEDGDGSLTGADNSVAEATGNTVTGTAIVTSEAGIATLSAGGQDITDASTTPVTLTGSYGTLVINGFDAASGVISYAYTEDGDAEDHSGGDDSLIDQFALAVTDLAGETASDTLDIQILDSAPVAEDDAAAIDEDTTTALTGDVLGNDSLGADTPSTVAFTTTAASYGTFTDNGDGSWSYTLDNSLAAVQALDDGDTLTETFGYTLTDADGDESTATLMITINGQTDGPPTIVVEDGDGSLTGADNSVAEATGNTVTGTAIVTSEAGIATLSAGGQDITDASTTPVTLTGSYGTLVINGFDAASGVISYAYTEDGDAEDHSGGDDSLIDQFALAVTDLAGETASDTLDIQILDSAPVAEDDTAALDEDATTALTGDVLDNDTESADVPSTVAFTTTAASYGTFTDNGDGTWSYALDNTNPAVQALDDGDTLTETFGYTLTDADGDQDTATLTITITGADDNASVATAAATGPDATVYEAGLNPHGSNAASDSETTTGSFTVSASDGIQSVVIGGTTFTLAQVQAFGSTPQTVNTGEGTLTLDGYAGNSVSGTIAYTYTLGATIDNDSKVPSGADAVTLDHFDDSIVIEVNGVGGSTANDDLVIRVIDDTPSLGTFMDGTIPNQIGTVTGLFDLAPGADGIKGFSITGPTLAGITYQPVVTSEINGDTTSVLTAISDPDGEGGADPTIVFSLSVREDGTYTFNLVTPKAAVTETFSLSNLSAGGPGFRELEDDPATTLNESGRIEFTSNGTGVNANSNNFGVSNSHIDSGEWFEMEFHNPGTLGNDPALTNTEYLNAVTVGVGRQDQGDVTIKWTAYNDGDGKQETGQFVYSGTTGFTIDPSIDFNRIRIENVDDPNNQTDGGRFSASTIGLTKTILPSDQFLDFDIAATDSDGDVTSTSTLSIHVVAQTDASSFTLAGTGADDAIAGSTLTDTINGGDGFNIADYSDSPTGVSIHLDASGNASGAPTDPVDPEVGTIGGGNATGDTLISIEGLIGSDEHDVLVGNDSNNYLSGGSGNDTLTGGLGADTFVWNFGDQGTSTDPAEDTVTDFTSAQGDVLDISDLLSSMSEGADLSSYIQAEESGSDTTLSISTGGVLSASDVSAADQKIVLKGVSMDGNSSAEFLDDMIQNGKLDIE